MSGKNLVICPVFNEEQTIEMFYENLRSYYKGPVLFVNDGSKDKSRNEILNIADDNTYIIRHPERYGYGQALISGFNFAVKHNYEKIVTLDTDLQHNPKDIPMFLRFLEQASVVLGSRYVRIDNCLDVPRSRLVINRYISKLIKLRFGYDFTDPFCGFRAYRRSFLENIRLKETSYGLSLELLLEIVRTRTYFKEVSIEAIYFQANRKFLDGLDQPRKRLLYYLEVIGRKNREIMEEVLSSRFV